MANVFPNVVRGLCSTALGQGKLPSSLRFLHATACAASFKLSDLVVERTKAPRPRARPEDLGFGKVFSDHMFIAQHTEDLGWSAPKIVPFQPLQMHPAAQVLHYGICCFEGMKAYTGVDGKGRLFRPQMNMARLQKSSQRLMLAEYDPQELLGCLKALLKVDRDWLPQQEGFSLYIRPFLFAAADSLGIHRPSATTVCIILSPVGPYFKEGALTGVSLFLDEKHVRAWPGGGGDTKIGSNYAPTIQPQVAASKQYGCSQVVYTMPNGPDAHDATLSECGAMNVFFLMERAGGGVELVTPPLDGTILPGVTRDSVIQLCRGWQEFEVSERPLSVGELVRAHSEGRLLEAFGTGTASVVQPITSLLRQRVDGTQRLEIPGKALPGKALVTQRLSKELQDIQYGRVQSEWSVVFDE